VEEIHPVYYGTVTWRNRWSRGSIYLNYRLAIDEFEGHGMRTVFGTTSTAEIFSTYPAAFLTTKAQFFRIAQGNFSNVR
jgi:hypothetical protein